MRQRAQDMRKLQDERVQRYSMVLRGLAETGETRQARKKWGLERERESVVDSS